MATATCETNWHVSVHACCPLTLPGAGEPCPVDGTTCLFEQCSVTTEPSIECVNGAWHVHESCTPA